MAFWNALFVCQISKTNIDSVSIDKNVENGLSSKMESIPNQNTTSGTGYLSIEVSESIKLKSRIIFPFVVEENTMIIPRQ
jgi:hypothetical protein